MLNPTSRVSRCAHCSAATIWLQTADYRNVVVNAENVGEFERVYNPERHTLHRQTCAQAQVWRVYPPPTH